MHQILKPILTSISLSAAFLIALLPQDTHAEPSRIDKPVSIVVTIKPLYSLLAHLTDSVTEPVLLFEQIPSAHHYNLRPSQRRLLADADMIVWVGPQMESYLTKVIDQSDNSTIVTAQYAKGLQLLSRRSLHSHDGDHNEIGSSTHDKNTISSQPASSHLEHNIDPHIWLSSINAAAISKHLSQALITSDPANREIYQRNLGTLIHKIKNNAMQMQENLPLSNQSYIAYHDAFQYIEDELGVNFSGAISTDEDAGTSLKHAREISSQISKENIQCLVYQAPKPAIVSSLQSQTSINSRALDPLGLMVKSDKNAWFELMQQLALNFKQCLSSDL